MDIDVIDTARTFNARTFWELGADGRLAESGSDFMKFARSAIDTEILLTLLKRNEELIHREANKERTKLFGREH